MSRLSLASLWLSFRPACPPARPALSCRPVSYGNAGPSHLHTTVLFLLSYLILSTMPGALVFYLHTSIVKCNDHPGYFSFFLIVSLSLKYFFCFTDYNFSAVLSASPMCVHVVSSVIALSSKFILNGSVSQFFASLCLST